MKFRKLDVSNSSGFDEMAVAETQVVVRYKNNPEFRYIYKVSAQRIADLTNLEKKGSYFFKHIRHDPNVKWKQL